jgi:hypothetical protein
MEYGEHMARKAKLTTNEIENVRTDSRPMKLIAADFGVSLLTIWKVKNFKEAYATRAQDLGEPILDTNGHTVGIRNVVDDEVDQEIV